MNYYYFFDGVNACPLQVYARSNRLSLSEIASGVACASTVTKMRSEKVEQSSDSTE